MQEEALRSDLQAKISFFATTDTVDTVSHLHPVWSRILLSQSLSGI